MSDAEIIQSVLQGNHQDYKYIVEKYQERIFNTAIGFVHNKQDADDITQDVFIKAYRSLHSFAGKSLFTTWIYRITVNMTINFIRDKKRKNFWGGLSQAFYLSSTDKKPDDILEQDNRRKVIQEAIDSLPDRQRTAFVLSKYDELPQKQIALVMNTSEGAIEQLISRAKNNLQKKLSSHKNF